MGLDYAEFEARAQRRRSGRPRGMLHHGAGRALVWAAAALAVATVAGLAILWPGGDAGKPHAQSQALGGPSTEATVVASSLARCPGPAAQQCRRLTIRVHGRLAPLTLGPVGATSAIEPGAAIRVRRNAAAPAGAAPAAEPYGFVDRDRRGSLLWLGIALAVAAIVVLWWRGALALIGVALSLLVLTKFVVPAMLAGESALAVALVGSLAVMWITLVLTNGFGPQTLAAALGIGGTLLATAGIASLAVHLAHLDGKTGDLSIALSQQQSGLSLQGVVLAGMIIGALGVLADTAVTQASAVMALRRANPQLGMRRLFSGAFSVGRDHLSATIHTLVLAYAGGALPLLLVLRSAGVGFDDGINTQDVAEPIVAGVVGCLGLVLAVPVTTLLASFLIARVPAELVPESHAGHAH